MAAIGRVAATALGLLLLLLGLMPRAHAIGPTLDGDATTVIAPAADELPRVIAVYLAAYRGHGPPAAHVEPVVALIVITQSSVTGAVGHPPSARLVLYAYCGGDPVNRTDSMGLDWQWNGETWIYIEGSDPDVPRPRRNPTFYGGLTKFSYTDYSIWAASHDWVSPDFDLGARPDTGPVFAVAYAGFLKAFDVSSLTPGSHEKAQAIQAAIDLARYVDAHYSPNHGSLRVWLDPSYYQRPEALLEIKRNYVANMGRMLVADVAPILLAGAASRLAALANNVGKAAAAYATAEAAAVGLEAAAGIAEAEAIAAEPVLWRGLPLARNLLQGTSVLEEQLAGDSVATRMLADRAALAKLRPGDVMKYVIDKEGRMYIGTAQKHSGLVPAGERVRAAGQMKYLGNGRVSLNAQSGHYMDGYFDDLSPEKIAKWKNAVETTAQQQGLTVESVSEKDYFAPRAGSTVDAPTGVGR